MRICELISNPSFCFSVPFRVMRYTDGPDSVPVFDSSESGDVPPDIMMKEVTAIGAGNDGILEIEYTDMLSDNAETWYDEPHRIATFYSDEWHEDIVYNASDAEQDSEISGQGMKSGKFYVLTVDDNGAPIRAELVQ